jgi:hypothetical protein
VKLHIIFLVFLTAFISGCDSWFERRIDVMSAESGIAVSKANGMAVLESIREYAKEENIPCRDSGRLPIECWRQPIRIWAISEGSMVVACYSAMGIPLEGGKFRKRMDRLEKLLRARVGDAAKVVPTQCLNPPMSLNSSDFSGK